MQTTIMDAMMMAGISPNWSGGTAKNGTQQGGFADLLMQLLGGSADQTGLGMGGTQEQQMDNLMDLLGDDLDAGNENAMSYAAMLLMGGQPDLSLLQTPMAYKGGTAQTAFSAAQQAASMQQLMALSGQDAQGNLQQLLDAAQSAGTNVDAFVQALTEQASQTGQGSEPGATVQQADANNGLDPLLNAYNRLYSRPGTKAATGEELGGVQQAGQFDPTTVQQAKPEALADMPSVDPRDVMEQVRSAVVQNLSSKKSEFVIKLKPEGLGSITVKLVENEGKISLSIITATQQAQNALSSEIGSLRQALRPYNAEVQQIVTSDSAAFAQQQSMSEHRHNGQESRQGGQGQWMAQTVEDIPSEQSYAQTVSSILNAYI